MASGIHAARCALVGLIVWRYVANRWGERMARARNIKPGFFTNDELAEVDPLGRLLFAGLWTIADREGRLEDRPKRIKAEVLPYDNCDCDQLLQDLHDRGFILRYIIGELSYIQIAKWTKHQNPHIKETASIIPKPDKHGASTVQEQEKDSTSPADSLNLIPDSGFPITDSLNQEINTTGSAREEVVQVLEAYQNNIHPVTGEIESDSIADLVTTYSAPWVKAAITESVNNGVRKLSYITAILERWHNTGLSEPWLKPKGKKKDNVFNFEKWKPQPRADCLECNGTGKIKKLTDDGSGNPLPITITCDCMKER